MSKMKLSEDFKRVAENISNIGSQATRVEGVAGFGVMQPIGMVPENFDAPMGSQGVCYPSGCGIQTDECASTDMLNQAVAECKHNSHCYRQAASMMKLAGLDEFHKHLKCMSSKWHDCSKSFVHLVEDLGCAVNFMEVKPVCNLPCDPTEVAAFFCNLEKTELHKLEELVKSTEASDVIVHEFLCHKLDKHVKMVGKACLVQVIFAQANGNLLLSDHSIKHAMRD